MSKPADGASMNGYRAIAALFLTVLLLATNLTTPAAASTRDDSIWVIGDSLCLDTVRSGQLRTHLAPHFSAVEIGCIGGLSAKAVKRLTAARDSVPETVLLSIGTKRTQNMEAWKTRITAIVKQLRKRGASQIVWTEAFVYDGAKFDENNEVLRALGEQRRFTVVSWSDVGSKHPEYYKQDRIHHTPVGIAGYTQFLVDSAVAGRDAVHQVVGKVRFDFNDDTDTLSLQGWAQDPDSVTVPADVRIVVRDANNRVVHRATPTANRNLALSFANRDKQQSAFAHRVQLAPGGYTICASGLDVQRSVAPARLGCATATLR